MSLIARRCIYGVDLNPLSVELARLSIWIHTFVPGLPLSVLDHNLVNGNALVGIGTIDEVKAKFEAASTHLFPVDADNLLGQAERPLKRLANLSDVTLTDVAKARDAMEEARIAVGDTNALCDIITAQRLDPEIYQFENWETERTKVQRHPARHRALKTLGGLASAFIGDWQLGNASASSNVSVHAEKYAASGLSQVPEADEIHACQNWRT